jgi:hypothetical protein
METKCKLIIKEEGEIWFVKFIVILYVWLNVYDGLQYFYWALGLTVDYFVKIVILVVVHIYLDHGSALMFPVIVFDLDGVIS